MYSWLRMYLFSCVESCWTCSLNHIVHVCISTHTYCTCMHMYIHMYKHVYICLLTCLWHYQRKHGVRKELRSSLWFALLLEDLKMVEKESSVTKSLRILLPSKWTQFPTPSFPGGTVLSLPWSPTPPLETWSLNSLFISLHSGWLLVLLNLYPQVSKSHAAFLRPQPLTAQFGFSLCFLILQLLKWSSSHCPWGAFGSCPSPMESSFNIPLCQAQGLTSSVPDLLQPHLTQIHTRLPAQGQCAGLSPTD